MPHSLSNVEISTVLFRHIIVLSHPPGLGVTFVLIDAVRAPITGGTGASHVMYETCRGGRIDPKMPLVTKNLWTTVPEVLYMVVRFERSGSQVSTEDDGHGCCGMN